MHEDERQKRHEKICKAAYRMLAQHGYGGTSMLRIATAAKASNETLYRWYGDKDGLFKTMVQDNAREAKQLLVEALDCDDDPRTTLESVAPIFLRMILGERAILLNRAAAADPSGALGATISAGGRAEIVPLFFQLMKRLCAGSCCEPAIAIDWFLGLLVGDLQVKRIIHQREALTDEDIESRCKMALGAFRRLIDSHLM